MGFKDRISSAYNFVVPGAGGDPDGGEVQDDLRENIQETEQDNYSHLEGVSGEEIAHEISDMRHKDRLKLAKSDEFIENHWDRTSEAIRNNEELSEEFGLNDNNFSYAAGGGKGCEHHDNAPVESDPIDPQQSETVGQSEQKHENMNESLGASASKVGSEHGEAKSAHASHTETRQGQEMEHCQANPDDCKTSKQGFYQAAERRHEKVTDEPAPEQFDKFRESEQAGQSETGSEEQTDGVSAEEADAQSATEGAIEGEGTSDGVTPDDTADAEETASDGEQEDSAEGTDQSESVSVEETQGDSTGDGQSSDEDEGEGEGDSEAISAGDTPNGGADQSSPDVDEGIDKKNSNSQSFL